MPKNSYNVANCNRIWSLASKLVYHFTMFNRLQEELAGFKASKISESK